MKLLDPFAVNFSGVHLIEASAGTGKTYNILSLYIRAVMEADRPVEEILVVTYTEAATKELRDRLMKRLRETIRVLEGSPPRDDSFLNALDQNVSDKSQAIGRLKKAVHSFDEAAVYTIHGFCRLALQEHAFNSGAPFEAELIGDDSEIIGEIVDDYWRKWVREATESQLKQPLLKLLLDKGYNPDMLTKELAGFVGKPYLDIVPDEVPKRHHDEKLYRLTDIFQDLKRQWERNRQEIFQLLDAGHLSYYRTDWLQGWMQSMDEWLQADVAPIDCFEKFERFAQSYINQSLKKASKKKGINPPVHPFFKSVDSYMDIAEDLQDFDIAFKHRLFKYILAKIDDKKEELQIFSFDDLLVRLRNALQHPDRGQTLRENLQQAYPIALVDEFQDTDPIQYEIFRSIYAGVDETALFMIGDPKQSIYSFRGADIFTYLQAQKDAPPEKTFSLGQNYRSTPPLIEGINALFKSHDNPFILEEISFEPVSAGGETTDRLRVEGRESTPIEIRQLAFDSDGGAIYKGPAKDRSALDVAVQIQKLLVAASHGGATIGNEPVQARDIAVLVRSHYQATLISDALMDKGIKSVKHSRESVFHSDEAWEIYLLLKAVVEPANERLITTALSGKIFGYKANELLALKENETLWAAKMEQFSQWHEVWQDRGFSYMFRTLMQQEDVAETVVELKDGERILTNLIHLSELIMKEEKEGKTGMHTLLKWLLKKRNEDNKEVEEEQLRLESDENLVSVVTMHHSKGLEYPIVFCPYLWDSPQNSDDGSPIVYHDSQDKSKVYLDLKGKNDPARSEKRYKKAKEELAEGIRLAYVAITRAKYKCVINWVPAKNAAHSPLGFLLLGSREAFSSLKASVSSDHTYDENNILLYTSAFDELATYASVECPVISDTEYETEKSTSDKKEVDLKAETFERAVPLPVGYGMASFSSLIRNEQDNFEPDLRAYYDEPFERDEGWQKSSAYTIFDFPKGPSPGTAVHHIFENIAFDRPADEWNTVIREQLQTQNIDDRWVSIVKNMIGLTVNKPLLADEPRLQLSVLNDGAMIPELEFYFTTADIRLSEILAIIRPGEPQPGTFEGFAEEGFLKGFIDLTFQYQDKFYILDYKTNHLGRTLADYRRNELQNEINEALYDVQYHLYIVALHRFLQQRMKNYHYEDHFGGAFYLFIRGINEKGREGIFFDRPDVARINKLNKYLKRKS